MVNYTELPSFTICSAPSTEQDPYPETMEQVLCKLNVTFTFEPGMYDMPPCIKNFIDQISKKYVANLFIINKLETKRNTFSTAVETLQLPLNSNKVLVELLESLPANSKKPFVQSIYDKILFENDSKTEKLKLENIKLANSIITHNTPWQSLPISTIHKYNPGQNSSILLRPIFSEDLNTAMNLDSLNVSDASLFRGTITQELPYKLTERNFTLSAMYFVYCVKTTTAAFKSKQDKDLKAKEMKHLAKLEKESRNVVTMPSTTNELLKLINNQIKTVKNIKSVKHNPKKDHAVKTPSTATSQVKKPNPKTIERKK